MNRRAFFRRAGTAVGAVAVVATPLALLAKEPEPAGGLVIAGARFEGGLTIDAPNGVMITHSYISGNGHHPAISGVDLRSAICPNSNMVAGA